VSDYSQKAYEEGWRARKQGDMSVENPYPESGHPRDTTYQDEMHAAWWEGWEDAAEDEANAAPTSTQEEESK
jgi:hypothetical protein